MPGRDKKGPEGEGPATGRRLGSCTADNTSDISLRGGMRPERRFSRGGNRSRGLRRWFSREQFVNKDESTHRDQ